jgi:uncharacterized protein with PIN domain
MSRIGKAYESRFRSLLLRLRTRQLDRGIRWLLQKSAENAHAETAPLVQALSDRYERLRGQVRRFEARTLRPTLAEAPRRFLCDVGLGGLARWLRAAGYEAFWYPDLEDAELLRRAQSLEATVLTTDSLMMERGVLRDGVIPGLWLPPVWSNEEQLAIVLREFELPLKASRCMICGGELNSVPMEAVRERIPPKTARWLNDYFQCAHCGRLFWHGTHWQRIQTALATLCPAKTGG